jgi:phosphopantetheinyl transferase
LHQRSTLKPLIWPEYPTCLDHDGLALILLNLPPGTHRAQAGQLARSVLREYLTALLPVVQIEIVESPSGPLITGSDLRISLSYAGDKALIGIARGRQLGVDIVKIERMDEIATLAKCYLPVAPLNDADFALAWAQMEACCKALKLPLSEVNDARKLAYAGCELIDCEQMDGYRIAVAVKQEQK